MSSRQLPDQRRLVRGRRSRCAGDRGYVIAMVGLLILPVMIFTAFAVDLGAWYAQSAKMQRAVDNAALAGVVWLPNKTAAEAAANNALQANGYTGPVSFSYPSPRQMKVAINRDAVRYFSDAFMDGTQSLTRSATAEFNRPVPLGSPAPSFGDTCQGDDCPTQPGIWGAINGPFTGHNQGDPLTTKCTGTTSGGSTAISSSTCNVPANANGAQNPDYILDGYLYAIDVPEDLVGSTVTVQIYDAVGSGASPNPAGDSVSGIFTTEFSFFDSDGSDVAVTVDDSLKMTGGQCASGPGEFLVASDTGGSYKDSWQTICSFVPTQPGIHPLRVKSSNIPGVTDNGAGTNQFSISALGPGSIHPTVYAISDMSIYSPGANAASEGGSRISRFYLANIGEEHRGKTLLVDLFDPGDGSGSSTFTMQFRKPPSGAPAAVPGDSGALTSCNYNQTGSTTFGPATPNVSPTCNITTRNSGTSIYDNRWLRVRISIPLDYSCSSDCWWTIRYNFGATGSSTDRTVWRVSVIGDPVHLVE